MLLFNQKRGENMCEKEIILSCAHCGNKAPMNLLNKFNRDTPFENGEYCIHEHFEFFECPVCNEMQLIYTSWNTEDSYHEDINLYDDLEVLYPKSQSVNLSGVPSSIKSAYESATKVRNIDNIVCVMALRRTLEMVCKDNGANSGQLHQKLNELQQRGVLPPLMGEVSKVIKDYGNKAAHGDEVEFDKVIVDRMFSFTDKVIEFVYILPKELRRAKYDLELLSEESELKA